MNLTVGQIDRQTKEPTDIRNSNGNNNWNGQTDERTNERTKGAGEASICRQHPLANIARTHLEVILDSSHHIPIR